MADRLTRRADIYEINKKADGRKISEPVESAEIVYTDKSKEELLKMQITGTDGIIGWYTTEEGMMLGIAGVI